MAAEIAIDVRPAHLPLVRVAVLKAIPAIGDDDPGIPGAHERVELLAIAMLGDLIIAEPKALIGFAGPRVIEQTIRQKLPKDFQRSEFLLSHGIIDAIVDRREMRPFIIKSLDFMMNPDITRESTAQVSGLKFQVSGSHT